MPSYYANLSASANFVLPSTNVVILTLSVAITSNLFENLPNADQYVINNTSGSLPPGMNLTSSGLIINAPTSIGTYNFAINASYENNNFAQSYSFVVNNFYSGLNSTTTSITTLSDSSANWTINSFVGFIVYSNNINLQTTYGTIISNTNTVLTVSNWSNGIPVSGDFYYIKNPIGAQGPNDFKASINIQSLNVNLIPTYASPSVTGIPNGPGIQGPNDFKASISIYKNSRSYLAGSVNFRVPPINEDLKVSAIFASNIIVYAQNTATNEIHQGVVGSDGYFTIPNLLPGTYEVTPKLQGYSFKPSNVTVTLNNTNANLVFIALGLYQIKNYNAITPSMCQIINNSGNSGTFSIDGNIIPDTTNDYQSILVVITDNNLAQAYQQTLSNG